MYFYHGLKIHREYISHLCFSVIFFLEIYPCGKHKLRPKMSFPQLCDVTDIAITFWKFRYLNIFVKFAGYKSYKLIILVDII